MLLNYGYFRVQHIAKKKIAHENKGSHEKNLRIFKIIYAHYAISGFKLLINWCWCILSASTTVISCVIPEISRSA